MEERTWDALAAPDVDDFEARRREQETTNEVFIHVVAAALLLLLAFAHWSNRSARWAPFPSPLPLVAVLAASGLLCLGIALVLHRRPVYRPGRKYLLTVLDFASFVPAYWFLSGFLPPLLLAVIPAPIGILIIVLSGLRYSTRVVRLAGATGVVIHVSCVALVAPTDFRIPLMATGSVSLISAAAITTYIVSSLMRLHRHAIVKERLSRFLAPELLEEIDRNPGILEQQTKTHVATVLFADVHGFTGLSEGMRPDEVVRLLNRFLGAMTEVVLQHRGMVDKYIGDAVMAVFGVPVDTNDHATQALRAARAMLVAAQEINRERAAAGKPALSIGIGLHTGEVVAGAVGSTHRLDYTVIGDTVNVASRIVALTGTYDVPILLSDTTRNALPEAEDLNEMGMVSVRGRRRPLRLWTPAA